MNIWLALSSLKVTASTQDSCQQFPAIFVGVIDQSIDAPDAFFIDDPDLYFFKEIMKFREDAIQHTCSDAIKFFIETYGLDFSLSDPNEKNQYVYENATMSPYRFTDDIEYPVILNNWIQSGRTRSTCYNIRDGGFTVTFSGDQGLHGSYGGTDGKPARAGEVLVYGFHNIEVCEQSPVIIQFQTASPIRQEPIDGTYFFNADLYNRVLGYGKARSAYTVEPDLENPGQYRFLVRVVFTFKAK
jgi:hypothetical protein